MPFTLAHPVFAFPLKWINRKYFSVTGLVLGSMSPDLEYFLHLEPYRSIGHTLQGFFLQAIPLSFLLAYVFHYMVKESIALHLPSLLKLNHRAYHMLGHWSLNSLSSWLVFLSSVFIGFLSHLTVDSFTHGSSFIVNQLLFLREISIGNHALYKLLQYGFSLFGLCVIGITIVYYLAKSSSSSVGVPRISGLRKVVFWTVSLLIGIAITWMKVNSSINGNVLGIMFVAPISGFCIGLIFSSMAEKMIRTK